MKKNRPITKKQRSEAEGILRQYKNQLYFEFVTPITCLCCKKTKIEPMYDNSINNMTPLDQHRILWKGGVVIAINPGFGSDYDDAHFFGALCDKCLLALDSQKIMINVDELEQKLINHK